MARYFLELARKLQRVFIRNLCCSIILGKTEVLIDCSVAYQGRATPQSNKALQLTAR
jgi:hypothetical protein